MQQTCDQLEKDDQEKTFKQLTTLQTSESRLVTKVTFKNLFR